MGWQILTISEHFQVWAYAAQFAAFCEDEILFFTFEILFCCWPVLGFLFKRLNKLLVESVCLRRLSCLESMSKETVMSQNYIQPHKDVEVYRSATFCPIKLWKPFCLYEYLESSLQVFSGLYFWFGGFHALFEILTSLSAESIATWIATCCAWCGGQWWL